MEDVADSPGERSSLSPLGFVYALEKGCDWPVRGEENDSGLGGQNTWGQL